MTKPTAEDLAFQAVFNLYFKTLLYYAYKRVNDWDLAQSIVTCVFAWLRAKRYDFTDKHIVRVLYAMVRRGCRDREHLSPGPCLNVDSGWIMTRGLVELTKALDALSPEQREAVICYFNEDRPAAAAAAIAPLRSEFDLQPKTASSL